MKPTTEQIWSDHHKELKAFTLSRVKDADLCNDILQDVFVKIHLHSSELENDQKVKQWVYQITRNTITDHFRKRKITLDTDDLELPEEIEESGANGRFARCISSFVKLLPFKYKEAVEMVELNNLSQIQLAEKLNISYSGAKSRVQRGRELLKDLVTKCCDISADRYGNIIEAKNSCTKCACQA